MSLLVSYTDCVDPTGSCQNTAQGDRAVLESIWCAEGVIDKVGGELGVTNAGTTLCVNVADGNAVIHGDDVPHQGYYHVTHDVAEKVCATTITGVNPRTDRLVLRIFDDTYDGLGQCKAVLEIIEGEPGVSADPPPEPANSITLALMRAEPEGLSYTQIDQSMKPFAAMCEQFSCPDLAGCGIGALGDVADVSGSPGQVLTMGGDGIWRGQAIDTLDPVAPGPCNAIERRADGLYVTHDAFQTAQGRVVAFGGTQKIEDITGGAINSRVPIGAPLFVSLCNPVCDAPMNYVIAYTIDHAQFHTEDGEAQDAFIIFEGSISGSTSNGAVMGTHMRSASGISESIKPRHTQDASSIQFGAGQLAPGECMTVSGQLYVQRQITTVSGRGGDLTTPIASIFIWGGTG